MVQDPVTLEWTVGEFQSKQKNLQVMSAITHTVTHLFLPPSFLHSSLHYPLPPSLTHYLSPSFSQDVLAMLLQNPKALSSVHITVPCPFIPSDHNSPSSTNMECDRGAITYNERVEQRQWGEVWRGTF